MQVSLRKMEGTDLAVLPQWYLDINGKEYTSRYTPKKFNGVDALKNEEYAWYMIQVNEIDCGVVFLEKEEKRADTAILGIMIGKNQFLGKGIGKKAISLVIEKAKTILSFTKVSLNVRKTNLRALKCYTDYGFKIVGQGEKITSTGEKLELFKMVLAV